MPCPFCQSTNPHNARACRVCGGPLRPVKPAPNLVVSSAPIRHEPHLLHRLNLDENSSPIVGVGACLVDAPIIGLFSENGALRLWDVSEDKVTLFSNRRLFRQTKTVTCASFAPHHDLMASGHADGEVRWFEFGGRELNSPPSHVGCVRALAWTPTHLCSGGSDGVIWATALATNEKSRVLIEGLGAMTTMAFSPDGSLLAVGRDDGAVQLWRLNDSDAPIRLDWTRRKHDAPLRSLLFSPDGAMIISRSADDKLCLWAAQTSYQLPLAPQFGHSRVAPAFAANSRCVAIANERNGVDIFDVALETLIYQLPPLGENVRHLAFSPDAELLIVAGAREVAVWEIANRME